MYTTAQNNVYRPSITSNDTAWRIFSASIAEPYDEGQAQLRMENEGGIAITNSQYAKIDSLCKATHFLKNIILRRWHDLPSMTIDKTLFETC